MPLSRDRLAGKRRVCGWIGLLAIVLLAVFLRNGPWFVSTDHEPVGDLAANLLQVQHARSGQELLGPYSRFQLHHPGPLSFYFWAAGDAVFRFLPTLAARAQFTQLLINLLLIASATYWVSRVFVGAGPLFFLFAWATLLLTQGGSGLGWVSIWGPRVVMGPVLVLLVAAGVTLAGENRAGPLAALGGALAVHNHIGTAVVVLPIAMVLAVHYGRGRSREGWRWLGWTMLVVGIAVAPPVIEELRSAPGNLSSLIELAGSSSWTTHSPSEVAAAVGGAIYSPIAVLANILGLSVVSGSRVLMGSWFLLLVVGGVASGWRAVPAWRNVVLLSALALTATWIGALRVTGPLHAYLFLYLLAPTMLLAFGGVWWGLARAPASLRWMARTPAVAVGIGALILFRPLPMPPSPELAAVVATIEASTPQRRVELDLTRGGADHRLWRELTGIVLRLREDGWTVYTSRGWDLLIAGAEHAPLESTVPLAHLFLCPANRDFGGATRAGRLCAAVLPRPSARTVEDTVAEWKLASQPVIGVGVRILAGDPSLAYTGWYAAEAKHRWSKGPRSSVRFRAQAGSYVVIEGGVVGQKWVRFLFNGEPIGALELKGFGPHRLEFEVPPPRWRQGTFQTLTVEISGALGPSEIDSRTLGFQLTSITIR